MDLEQQVREMSARLCTSEAEVARLRAALAEAAAQAERMRVLIGNAPFGALEYTLAPDGRLVFCGYNAAAERILGVSCAEFIDKTLEEAFPPLADTPIPAAYRRVALTGERYDDDQVTYTRGEISGVYEIAAFQTAPRRMAVFFRDITERRKAEAAQAKSERLLRDIINNTDAVIYVKNLAGRYLLVNNAFARLFQRPSARIIGHDDADLYPPGSPVPAAVCANDREVLARGEPAQFEERIELLEGPRTYVSVKFPLRDTAGKLFGIGGISTDITARKAAEAALQASEVRYRAIYDAIPDAVAVVEITPEGGRGHFLEVNDVFCQRLGYTREELLQLGPDDIDAPPAEGGTDTRPAFRAALGGESVHMEQVQVATDGRHIPVDIYHQPLEYQGRRAVFAIIRDITERKAAETALRESEARYRSLYDAIPDGVAVTEIGPNGVPGHFLEVNAVLLARLGYTREEMLRMGPRDIDAPAEAGGTDSAGAFSAVLAGQLAYLEQVQIAKDGRRIPVDIYARPVAYQGRRAAFALIRDITARKSAEKALQRSNRSLRMLSDSNQILIRAESEQALLDQVCASIIADGGYCMAWIGLKRDPADAVAWPAASAGTTDGYLDALAVRWKLGDACAYPSIEALVSGVPVIVADLAADARFAPWRDEALCRGYRALMALPVSTQGEMLGALCLYQTEAVAPEADELRLLTELAGDLAFGITALRTREALERERALLAGAIDILPYPIFFQNPDDTMMRNNRAFADAVAPIDPRTIRVGEDVHAFDPFTQREIAWEDWPEHRALRGEVLANHELLLRLPDGRMLPIWVQAGPVYVDQALIAVVVSFQDISALKEADRAKNQFLMVLSHELKTPLTSIRGWAQAAEKMPDLVTQALPIILRNVDKQTLILEDLLDVSRIVSGRFVVVPEACDLGVLAHQAAEDAMPEATTRGLQLVEKPSPDPLPVSADPGRLTQAIRNLLTNALKFTPAGGTITVSARREGAQAVVAVRDTGRGLAAADLPNLFLPFTQVARSEKTGGLGLGLSLVRGIIAAHGGEVTAASPGPLQGSTFTLRLPLRDG